MGKGPTTILVRQCADFSRFPPAGKWRQRKGAKEETQGKSTEYEEELWKCFMCCCISVEPSIRHVVSSSLVAKMYTRSWRYDESLPIEQKLQNERECRPASKSTAAHCYLHSTRPSFPPSIPKFENFLSHKFSRDPSSSPTLAAFSVLLLHACIASQPYPSQAQG